MTSFRHSGDFGDCVVSLAVVYAHSDPDNTYYLVDRLGITHPMSPRAKALIPLIEAQPYISDCRLSEQDVDCDFVNFRHFHRNTHSLLASHLAEYQLQTGNVMTVDGSKPWLTATASPISTGRIVVAKSHRYGNLDFPWTKIVRHYGKRLLFVGNVEEHASFVQSYGWVKYQKTADLLEVAQLIAGAALFIGNQSSPLNIAFGLGADIIEEVCAHQPDCIYPRKNVQYVCDGSCILPDIDGSGTLQIDTPEADVSHFSTNVLPPGYWQYAGLPAAMNFSEQKSLVKQLESCEDSVAAEKLLRYNVKRVPAFFAERGSAPHEIFKAAYEKAFQLNTK